ncbi:MAG: hypothetical protein IH944_03510 [Armatimonadetes bacterium]|nr:hypothetical protein [Armatimonadota bacterium]
MKGIDWGRIMARLLAVALFAAFIGRLTGMISMIDSPDYRVPTWPAAVYAVALLTICVLLWIGAVYLVPPSAKVEINGAPDSVFAARAIVMCAGLWFLVFYGGKATASIFYIATRTGAEWHWFAINPTFILYVVAALLGGALIIFPSVILGRTQK